ncbi:hypothetical protein KBB08_02130 [Candidatus Gracilibacteria bacterium]|nr:hypothetical protein [Candidatus Gracilibacteria bacterium]
MTEAEFVQEYKKSLLEPTTKSLVLWLKGELGLAMEEKDQDLRSWFATLDAESQAMIEYLIERNTDSILFRTLCYLDGSRINTSEPGDRMRYRITCTQNGVVEELIKDPDTDLHDHYYQ